MKNLLMVLVALAFMFTLAYAGSDPKFTKVYKTSKGDVTFNHDLHLVSGKCEECHSLFPNGVNKDTGHGACKSCHKESLDTSPNAPVACTGCHKR